MRLGPWYGDGEESHRSCRHLRECVTEFDAQGLELDATAARLQGHGVKVLG